MNITRRVENLHSRIEYASNFRWRPLPVTPTWVARTSTVAWWHTSHKSSQESSRRIWRRTNERFVGWEQRASAPREPCPHRRKPTSKSIPCSMASTFTRPSRALASRSSTKISSSVRYSQLRKLCETPRWTNLRFTTSCSSVARLEFHESRGSFRLLSFFIYLRDNPSIHKR